MIDRVEFSPFDDSIGVIITFYYDTDCQDSFTVHDGSRAREIMEMMMGGREPEHVLIAIRDLGHFSLH